MAIDSIKTILMTRDNLIEDEALELIQEAKDQLYDYLDHDEQDLAYNICAEMFGLEPDYIEELMPKYV